MKTNKNTEGWLARLAELAELIRPKIQKKQRKP